MLILLAKFTQLRSNLLVSTGTNLGLNLAADI
jgi:hypothetical protein